MDIWQLTTNELCTRSDFFSDLLRQILVMEHDPLHWSIFISGHYLPQVFGETR